MGMGMGTHRDLGHALEDDLDCVHALETVDGRKLVQDELCQLRGRHERA